MEAPFNKNSLSPAPRLRALPCVCIFCACVTCDRAHTHTVITSTSVTRRTLQHTMCRESTERSLHYTQHTRCVATPLPAALSLCERYSPSARSPFVNPAWCCVARRPLTGDLAAAPSLLSSRPVSSCWLPPSAVIILVSALHPVPPLPLCLSSGRSGETRLV